MNLEDLAFVIFCLLICLIMGSVTEAQVSMGGDIQGQPKIIIGDFHSFDLTDKDMFGFERYGFGRGQMELTDRLGVLADNRSGLLLGSGDGLKLGIEPAVGSVGYHDRPEYQWEPGVSGGLREAIGKLGFYVATRAGMSYSNHANDYFAGYMMQLQVFGLRASYWENDYKWMPSLRIYDLDLFDKINIQKRYQNNDDITTVGVRFEL